ncbi:MAG: CAP domain-containing protein, partial [Actinomycetota bacterium]|nr:CAP domain-containing protein [Actinomycetota bacterium]
SRAAHGLQALRLSERISRRAHRHSMKMARSRTLFHSCVSCKYRSAAENVGVARSMNRVHQMMMNSAQHRSNILNSRFSRAGFGVVKRGGRYWVTEVFIG